MFLVATLMLTSCNDKPKKLKVDNLKESRNTKKEYFDDGTLKVEKTLKDGLEHGRYISYFNNGSVEKVGLKIKGKMNGVWKNYNELGEIVSVNHYYNDDLLYNLDIDDFTYADYNVENFMTINIPSKWKIIKNVNSKEVLLSVRKDCGEKLVFCPTLTITAEPLVSEETGINTYLDNVDDFLQARFDNYKEVKGRKFSFEGNIYYEKIYIGSIQGIKLGGISTWIFTKKRTFVITGLALNDNVNPFLKQEGLFKDISNSIKLIN